MTFGEGPHVLSTETKFLVVTNGKGEKDLVEAVRVVFDAGKVSYREFLKWTQEKGVVDRDGKIKLIVSSQSQADIAGEIKFPTVFHLKKEGISVGPWESYNWFEGRYKFPAYLPLTAQQAIRLNRAVYRVKETPFERFSFLSPWQNDAFEYIQKIAIKHKDIDPDLKELSGINLPAYGVPLGYLTVSTLRARMGDFEKFLPRSKVQVK